MNPETSPRPRAMYSSWMLAERAPSAWLASQTSHCAASAVGSSVVNAAVQARSPRPCDAERGLVVDDEAVAVDVGDAREMGEQVGGRRGDVGHRGVSCGVERDGTRPGRPNGSRADGAGSPSSMRDVERRPTMRNGALALDGRSRLGGLMALRDRLHGWAGRVEPRHQAPPAFSPGSRSTTRRQGLPGLVATIARHRPGLVTARPANVADEPEFGPELVRYPTTSRA